MRFTFILWKLKSHPAGRKRMDWLTYDIQKIDRLGHFPFQVKMLYFSHRHSVERRHGYTPEDMLEISIRFEPRDSVCLDIINDNTNV